MEDAQILQMIPLERLEPFPSSVRVSFNEEILDELVATVKTHGVLEPLIVRPAHGSRYQIVAGYRRWLAARKAGLTAVPCIIRNLSDQQALEITVQYLM